MPVGTPFLVVVSILLVLGSAFFVAAEYSMVSSRRSRLEAIARRGNRRAASLGHALDDLSVYVAASQIGITMLGIGIGAITEPFVTSALTRLLGRSVDARVSYVIAFLLVVFVLVVVGELVPKYATLRNPERAALFLYPSLSIFTVLFRPLTWLAQITAGGILHFLGVQPEEDGRAVVPKEELLLLVQSGGAEGALEKRHAELVSRALRLDVLTARDIMVHRLDVKWLDIDTPMDQLLDRLQDIPYSRIPVCRGDLDDLVGIIYVHDLIRCARSQAPLSEYIAEAVVVPENLSMGRIVETMRSSRTQILVVVDEYGGTSGIITVEDVVEEVFGELEDRPEAARPAIEARHGGRFSARADVRYDELVQLLGLPLDPGASTDTLATIVIARLQRMPVTGDAVETSLGTMRVENMARSRITRVSITLSPELRAAHEASKAEPPA